MENISITTIKCGLEQNATENFYEFRKTVDLILGIFCIVLIPLILSGNFLVLISLWKFKKLRTITNTLIGNLSVADSILGLVTLPVYVLFYLNHAPQVGCSKYLCLFKYSSVACSMSASMINLVAIALDRYIAILHPLKYKTILTSRRVKIFIILMWIYLLPICIMPYFWNNYDSVQYCDYFRIFPKPYTIYASFVSIFISLFTSLYLYIRIYLVARKQQERVKKDSLQSNNVLDKQLERDTKSAKVMALVLFLFYIFWFPFALTGPLKYLSISDNLAESLKNITLTIAMSNSTINPIIYCWLRRDFNHAFVRIMRECYCCAKEHLSVTRKESILLSYTNSLDRQDNGNADQTLDNDDLDSPDEANGKTKLNTEICS